MSPYLCLAYGHWVDRKCLPTKRPLRFQLFQSITQNETLLLLFLSGESPNWEVGGGGEVGTVSGLIPYLRSHVSNSI